MCLGLAIWLGFGLGAVRAGVPVIDAGDSFSFTAPSGATNYSWRLDGGVLTNSGGAFVFTPGAREVGPHWVSVDTRWADGSRSNQNWLVRVRIPLPGSGASYYVATGGQDSNPGTLAAPFLTLERARNAIRTNGVPAGGVSVWLRGGLYWRTNTFDLTAADSGRPGAPVIYRAYPGETPVLTTGTPVNSNSFARLNTNLWSRVMPGVTASNILELDLVSLGITSRGPFPTEYSRCPIVNPFSASNDGGLCELYFNGARLRLSRYPNNNPTNRWLTPYMKMNGVIFKTATNFMGTNIGGMFKYHPDDAPHISRWLTAAAETNLWIQGFWRVPWESEGERVLQIDTVSNTIATASGATPGVTGFGNKYSGAEGSLNEPYWALNLLEEIDQPGEWAIDFFRRKLYLLPPGPVTNGGVVIADRAIPVVRSSSASDIVFTGLTFDLALERGIALTSATNSLILGCRFKNLGSFAVDINGGVSNGVVSCEMTQLAAGGVYVQGGSEASPRVSCDHFVVNNHITDFAQVVPVYAAAVDAGFGGMAGGGGGGGHKVCVGARIAHNRIQGTPHGPVVRGSFDKVFEFNWIEEYTTISGDFGGIYCFQSTNQGGFDILRYNYFYCPTNYVYPTYLNPGPTGGIGIQVDSTWAGDEMYGNIATGRRSGFGAGGGGGEGARFYNNFTVNCGAGGTSWSGGPAVYENNFGALGSTSISGEVTGPNMTYGSDPGFIDWPNRDLRMDPESRVYTDLPDFREVPFELIGLYNDEMRTNVAVLPPVVRNAGVANLTAGNATLQGELLFPWMTPGTTVRVFWGANDGGTNAANWANVIDFDERTRGLLATNLAGLSPTNTYYFRFQASNSAAVIWASSTAFFNFPISGKQMAIGFPGYARPDVLTNFPALVVLGTNIPGFSYAGFLSPAGNDLRFKAADAVTELNFEIESWNTNGLSHVWVQVPALASNTTIRAMWGNPAATNRPASSTNGAVWSGGFLGVWHLAETSGPHYDSTRNYPTSRWVNVAQQGTAAGIAGGCDNFIAAQTNYVSLPDLGTQSAVTVECWANLNGTPGGSDIGLVSSDPWSTGITHFKVNSSFQVKAGTYNSGSIVSPANLVSPGAWFHAAYSVADAGTNGLKLFVNGALIGSAAGAANNNLTDVNLAREYNGRYLSGRLDEVRISSVARSSNWLWATWQNITANSTFNSYASVAVLPPELSGLQWEAGRFRFSVAGAPGCLHTLQASTNLTAWEDLHTWTQGLAPTVLTDANAGLFGQRFYRVLISP